MDTLTVFKLQEGDKERLVKIYEKKVSNAIYSSFSGTTNIFYGVSNPYTLALTAITQLGGAYVNYRRNIEEYREELDESMWKLEKEAIRELNHIQKEFLQASWTLMKKYDIPDKWRLTDEQLIDYVEDLKDENIEVRLRKLQRKPEFFEAYPPFWYYLAITAVEANKKGIALDALNKFENIRKEFFRVDRIYTSALMSKILLLDTDKDKERILFYLKEIKEESIKDWKKNLFVALKYIEYENYKEAEELLQINVDYNKNKSLNMRILGELYFLEKNKTSLEELVKRMVDEDKVHNQDILYLLGRVPEKKRLNLMKNMILGINLYVDENLIGKDNLNLSVPVKWIIEDAENFTVGIKFDNKQIKPVIFEAIEGGKAVLYVFENVFDYEDIKKKNVFPIDISLSHPSLPLEIIGEITETCEEKNKGSIEKGFDVAKSWKDKMFGKKEQTYKSETKTVCNPSLNILKVKTDSAEYTIKDTEFM